MAFARRSAWFLLFLALISPISTPEDLAAKQADPDEKNDAVVTIHGKVASDNGPVFGAVVYVFGENGLLSEAVSDESGKFQIDLNPIERGKILVKANNKIGLVRSLNPQTETPVNVVLEDQSKPLTGRIIDSQGRGVENAILRITSLRQDNLTLSIPTDLVDTYFDASTDEKGNFHFEGIEASMVGQIRVQGPGFVDAYLSSSNFEDEIVLVVQPGRIIKGKVVDQNSKQPLANVSIQAGGQQTKVGENGEFELQGIPAFQPVQVTAQPTGKHPYLQKSERIPVEQGFDPSVIEIGLEPGVWVNCKVKDFGNNGPASAEVFYFPTPENENFQSFVDSFLARGTVPSSYTNPTGDAAIVAIPGPGVIAIVASGFPPNESVNQLNEEQRAMLLGVTRRNDLTAVAWIDPEDLNDQVELNFVVSKGRAIDVELTDERINATDRLVVHRAASKTTYSQRVVGNKFVAQQFQPGETRQILIHAVDKRLGAILDVRAEAESPVKVGLQPTGSVLGQIVDKLGDPEPGLLIEFEAKSTDGYQKIAASAFTDVNGRFEKPSLVASLEYRIAAVRNSNSEQMKSGAPMMDSRWYVAEQLQVNSNETIDLGKLVLGAEDQPEPSRRARKTVELAGSLPPLISGLITNQSGKPIADAVVLFNTWPNRTGDWKSDALLRPQVLAQARSDTNGNFQITIDSGLEEKLISSDTDNDLRNAAIVVEAEEQGVMQIPLQSISDPQDLKIQMVREMIVRGNFSATDNAEKTQLMPGPQMKVYDNDSIKQIVAGLQAGKSLEMICDGFQPISIVDPLAAGLPLSWDLSSTGAFLIRNIPLNAIFELHTIGESGQTRTVTVISRPLRGFDIKPFEDSDETMQLQGSRIRLKLHPADVTGQ